jgi:hypothetical protein
MNPHDLPPIDHAEAAAEGIRWLNHTTIHGGYELPSDVDSVIGQLQTLAERLPQTLTQAHRWLAAEHQRGRIGLDNETSAYAVETAVIGALFELRLAVVRAEALAEALRTAHRHTTRMTGVER